MWYNDNMLYIKEVRKNGSGKGYPFDVPAIGNLERLTFEKPITVLCGDNGCGKTTLVELLVRKARLDRICDTAVDAFRGEQLDAATDAFTVVREAIPKKRYFFSAEEFIKYIEWVESEKRAALQAIAEIDAEYGDNVSAAALAKMPHCGTLADLSGLYAADLIRSSHGEGYMAFFESRLKPDGLYIMDEPEGALTYANQYLLAMHIRAAVKADCQFIVSTHSPVLAAIPEADIIRIKDGAFERVVYEQLDDVAFLEMFLRRRAQLFADDE